MKTPVRKAPAAAKLLTETELEMMKVLWEKGEGSVHDVIDALPPGRDLAYTSVSTILRILEQKDIVTTRKEGRGHVYIPKVGRENYEKRTVKDVVARVFDGTPSALVRRLLSTENLDREELKEIEKLLKARMS